MSNKDNKNIDEQEKLLDHLIEYGGRQYIKDEVKKYEDLPELEPSKEFDERMNRMFQDAYKKEVHQERIRLGKKVAVVAVAVIGVISAAAMNIKAVREPVLNFVFHKSDNNNKTTISLNSKNNIDFTFNYIPSDYKLTKKTIVESENQIAYEFYNKQTKSYFYIKIHPNSKYENYAKMISNEYSKITKNSVDYYSMTGKKNHLLWYKNRTIFNIISNLSTEDAIKISENMKRK